MMAYFNPATRACRQESWEGLLAAYAQARAVVAGEWARVAGLK
jgi:hypothetical protein